MRLNSSALIRPVGAVDACVHLRGSAQSLFAKWETKHDQNPEMRTSELQVSGSGQQPVRRILQRALQKGGRLERRLPLPSPRL
jgi:hypothetical protein